MNRIHVFDSFQEKETLELTATYLVGSGDSSQTAKAIDKYIHFKAVGEIIRSLPFTSQRQFGAVEVKVEQKTFSLVMAGPDQLLPHMQEGEGQWLKEILATTERGKRLVCVARASVPVPPQSLLGVVLHPMIVFEMESKLRVGTRNIIDFFQKRGVRVRVISGDSPETVSTIAREAGIHNPNVIITGSEIEAWSEEEFKTRLDQFTIFARIRPELKENLIEHFRAKGFTAMVGDGANDALAIKKADLGIAMFEGAAATRQLASVVLTNNSFSALPEGIRLADTIIGNIHIISSLYFFEMGLGFKPRSAGVSTR